MTGTRHLLTLRDVTGPQIEHLFRSAAELKRRRIPPSRPLAGKTLALLFYKPSVRTRVSFEVGMSQLGGTSLYIGPVELQGGKRESPRDMARVLCRYVDGIVARTFAHADVEELARFSSVPVINGLSDDSHPCQALADLFTVQEKIGKLKGVQIAYVGDGNNVCHSLMKACALTGAHLTVASPKGYTPCGEVLRWALASARSTGARIRLVATPGEGVRGAQIVYTDVWTSMGQEKEAIRRRRIFRPFQVNRALLRKARPGALFMHCLPAHRGEEVTDEVMDSPRSIVYDQAENRLHVQKAILLMLLK